ncbi:MAG: hypothetical protein HY275_02720 [Gemmatimonadetes bacterium]|nr:hypothetical protein [Gemmatimonadota bacterium]
MRACGTLRALVARDSGDADALYGVGECEYHAGLLVPEVVDSVNGRMRGSWNTALAAFRRVLLVDPTYHPAFGHVLDILQATNLAFCAGGLACGNDPTTFNASVVRDGDSLLIQPVRGDFRVKTPWRARQTATRTPLRNAQAAQRIAQEWVDAGPAEPRARVALAQLDLRLGDPAAALRELAVVGRGADAATRRATWIARAQAGVVLGEASIARAALDSLRRLDATPGEHDAMAAQLWGALGRLEPLRTLIAARARAEGWAPERLAYWQRVPRILLGLADGDLADVERRYFDAAPGDTACAAGRPRCRVTNLLESLSYAPRVRRTRSYFAVAPVGSRFFGAYAIEKGDSAYRGVMAQFIDSLSTAARESGSNDNGTTIHATELALARRDTTTALTLARRFTDTVLPSLAYLSVDGQDFADWAFLTAPRMILLRADLAMATGARDEARTWYARLLALWSEPDAELQPTVARVRAALAALGGR